MNLEEHALMCMVEAGQYERLEIFLKNKMDVNFRIKGGGVTPLLVAIERGEVRIVKLLLEHGADSNMTGRLTEMHYAFGIPRQDKPFEWSPLLNAAMFAKANIVRLLLDYGADINFRDINGRSSLNAALQCGSKLCAKILIKRGAEVQPLDLIAASVVCPDFDIQKILNERIRNKTTKKMAAEFLLCSRCGDKNKFNDCIKRGIDINFRDEKGNTALHYAVGSNNVEIIEILIKRGADVNVHGENEMTALHIAASLGIPHLLLTLLANGAVVDAKASKDMTPLQLAVCNSHPDCVNHLLNHGASVKAVLAGRETALHLAVRKSPECIEPLLRDNADIFAKDKMDRCPVSIAIDEGLHVFKKLFPQNYYNVKNDDGITPMHYAASSKNTECLEFLINQGCDVNVVCNNGDSPLLFACMINNKLDEWDIPKEPHNIELLLKSGARIDLENNMKILPVHLCAQNGLTAHLRVLSMYGADLNAPGGEKQNTPLHYAAESGKILCIEFLLEKGVSTTAANSDNCTALMLSAKNAHFTAVKYFLEHGVFIYPPDETFI